MRLTPVILIAAITVLAGCLPVTTRVPAGSMTGFKIDLAQARGE